MSKLSHRDIVPSLLLLLLGGYALWEAKDKSPFGAIFPILAASGMLLGGVALAVRAVLLAPVVAAPEGQLLRPLALLAVLLGWAILMPITGFVPTSCIGVLLVMTIAQQTRVPLKTVAIQGASLIGLVGVVAVIFGALLNVPLP